MEARRGRGMWERRRSMGVSPMAFNFQTWARRHATFQTNPLPNLSVRSRGFISERRADGRVIYPGGCGLQSNRFSIDA